MSVCERECTRVCASTVGPAPHETWMGKTGVVTDVKTTKNKHDHTPGHHMTFRTKAVLVSHYVTDLNRSS